MTADSISAPLAILLWVGVLAIMAIPAFLNGKTGRPKEQLPLSLAICARILLVSVGFGALYFDYRLNHRPPTWMTVLGVGFLSFILGNTTELLERYFREKLGPKG